MSPLPTPHSHVSLRAVLRKFLFSLWVGGILSLAACGGNDGADAEPKALADSSEGPVALAVEVGTVPEDIPDIEDTEGDLIDYAGSESDDQEMAEKSTEAGTERTVSGVSALLLTEPAAATSGAKSTGGNIRALATTQSDAVRLAHQATFGPSEALVKNIRKQGAARWISSQMKLNSSTYTTGGSGAIHKHTNRNRDFCSTRNNNCWRDWYSTTPLVWDFYRNATTKPDQLRQRVALALQQIVVVSNLEVSGTYGFKYYNNTLLKQAFGNYREVLRKVILSPVMGDYLNNANNDRNEPNENFARELLQLFSVGTCNLNADGTLAGGVCTPTYDNEIVRSYAYALTGWTYPRGGKSPWGCGSGGTNCRYYQGDMVPVAARHNTQALTLLSGQLLAEGHSAQQALDAVLNSLMAHPNTAPFVSRQLIQHLVTSNPSPAYVTNVANAFTTGRFGAFGTGRPGDMKAVVAAILLDPEARTETPANTAGRLREPVQLFTGAIRALNGRTDGDALSWGWGEELRQHVFRSPSVFNFYPPDYPVPGTSLVGPAFGIHNANAALQRMNYLNYLVFWGGSQKAKGVPRGIGTFARLQAFTADATDPARLVDRLALLNLGEVLPETERTAVINAVAAFGIPTSGTRQQIADAKTNRVRQAAFLVLASPQYQLIR